MFIDARSVSAGEEPEADICIIGAGAAGITLAREFAGGPQRVLLLESGGLEYDAATQSLYEGEVGGVPVHPLNLSRLRFFGGSTNHWGGLSRPLDAIDYQPRAWVPHSGWPFDYEHMKPFYERAQAVCELGPYAYDVEDWETPTTPPLQLSERMASYCFQNSTPTRFGERYRDELKSAENVHVYLHANAVELEPDQDVTRVTHVQVATLEGNRFRIKAKAVVLASGGIENARLLLASNSRQAAGLGNDNDLIGRYFMEHPTLTSGLLVVTDAELPMGLYQRHRIHDVPVQGFLRPSDTALEDEQLLNCNFMTRHRVHWRDQSEGVAALRAMLEDVREGSLPDELGSHILKVITDIDGIVRSSYGRARGFQLMEVHYGAEQCPNPDSRVTLADSKDPFDKPRVRLEWRLTEADRRTADRAHTILASELGAAGVGRLRLDFDTEGVWTSDGIQSVGRQADRVDTADDGWHPRTSHHHMGTTRMHIDPKAGVVDADARVHALSNVYVAGSSIFPTVGHTAPTLTIVATSIRLADHLKGEFA